MSPACFRGGPKLKPLKRERPLIRLDKFNEPRIVTPPRLEAALIAMFAAGLLAGAGLCALIGRLIFLKEGCL